VIDGILSIPFKYPLLQQMRRTDAMVFSAILYAFRLHRDTGKFFYLSDQKIADWTGYKRTAIYEARKRLVLDGWIVLARGYNGHNKYQITDEVIARLEALDGQSRQKQQERLRKTAEKAVGDLRVDLAVAKLLIEFIVQTGQMPSRKTLQRWIIPARKLVKEYGVTAETLSQHLKEDKSMFGLMKRMEKHKPKQPEEQIEYDVYYDEEQGWIAEKKVKKEVYA